MRKIGQIVAVAMALVAVGAVLIGWLQEPDPITADEAVEVATDALRSADVDGRVAADASSGTYEHTSGDPGEGWKRVPPLDGGGRTSPRLAQGQSGRAWWRGRGG